MHALRYRSALVASAALFLTTLANAADPPGVVGSALRYDLDYPLVRYGEHAANNSIARLQEQLNRGEVKLQYKPARGYLDSLLKALDIDLSSQTLVYSKTSLQFEKIRAAAPRAVYFNEDTYIAWVQGSTFLEIMTMDSELGPVFYTLENRPDPHAQFGRETLRCLTCHDTFSLSGGGVPKFLFLSSLVSTNGESLTGGPGSDTTDQTPLRERWGGWYVTGQHGDLQHLGNLQMDSPAALSHLDDERRGNLTTLVGLLDTRPYPTDKSDIVALLVFEHQAYVQNFITRAHFKTRTILSRLENDNEGTSSWSSLKPATQRALTPLFEPLVRALLFVDAAEIPSKITGTSGFDRWFQAQGPRDSHGRSLRDLDLTHQLFRYRMSYLVYSEAFDGLPPCAQQYVYSRFREILSGRDQSAPFAHLSAQERADLLAILTETKPAFRS